MNPACQQTEPLPLAPMQNPAFAPDIDQADTLPPPQTLLAELRDHERILKAACAHLMGCMGIAVCPLTTVQIDLGAQRCYITHSPGGAVVRRES